MKRRRTKKKPEWFGVRVDALIRACGWPQREWRRYLGFGPSAVRRVLRGGRPKLVFLENLAQLEGFYAQEIEAFERGYVIVRGRKRFVFADLSHPGRLMDLSVLRFSKKL